VWAIVAGASLGNAVFAAFPVLGPVVAKRSLGGAAAWAAIAASVGVGALVGGLITLRVRPPRPLLAGTLAIALVVLPLFALAIPAPVVVIAGAALLAGLGMMVFNALWETALQRHVPARALSRVSAYDWFGSLVFQPIGLAVVGPAAAGLGVSSTLVLAGALQLAIVAAMLAVPDIRGLRATEAPEPALVGAKAPGGLGR
jgi:hypothetical protein